MLKNNKRLSSIELLRIISMLLIIAYHWELHGCEDSIMYNKLSYKQFFSFSIGSWGTLAVNLFFMISAYFLNKSNRIKLNRVLPLIIKVSFYGASVLIIANLFGVVSFSTIETVKSILGVFAFQYWFFSVYIIIYCIHPILNFVIRKITKDYYVFVLITLFIVSYCSGFIFDNVIIGRLMCGITIYFIIGFLERFSNYNIFNKHGMLISLLGIVVVISIECVLSYLGMNYNSSANSVINRIQTTQSPFMLILALFVFYFTLNLDIKQSNIINFIGKYSSGAYLLHGGSSFIKSYLWDGLFEVEYYYNNSTFFQYALHYILCVVLLFGIGCLVEFIVDFFVSKFVNYMCKLKMFVMVQQCLDSPINE